MFLIGDEGLPGGGEGRGGARRENGNGPWTLLSDCCCCRRCATLRFIFKLGFHSIYEFNRRSNEARPCFFIIIVMMMIILICRVPIVVLGYPLTSLREFGDHPLSVTRRRDPLSFATTTLLTRLVFSPIKLSENRVDRPVVVVLLASMPVRYFMNPPIIDFIVFHFWINTY